MAVTMAVLNKLYRKSSTAKTSEKPDIKCICSALNVYLGLFLRITALLVTHENCLRQNMKQDLNPSTRDN